jgi:hypothetical protein
MTALLAVRAVRVFSGHLTTAPNGLPEPIDEEVPPPDW